MAKRAARKKAETIQGGYKIQETPVLTNDDVKALHADVSKAYSISRDKSVNKILERVVQTLAIAVAAIPE